MPRAQSGSQLEKAPVPKDDNEKKILSILDDIITLVEGDAHEQVKKLKHPIDILFLDADKQGYIDYLDKLLPLVRPGGLIIAHNITPGMADPGYMEAITTNPDLRVREFRRHHTSFQPMPASPATYVFSLP